MTGRKPTSTLSRCTLACPLVGGRRRLLSLKLTASMTRSTYWMNLLQSIPEKDFGPVLVTLNPPFEPKPELVSDEYWYEHPLFSELVRRRPLPSPSFSCAHTHHHVRHTERQVARLAANDSEQARPDVCRRVDEIRFRAFPSFSLLAATLADPLPHVPQHEDGFASGLRVATEHLSATLPFPLQHAERSLTLTTSDRIITIILSVLESVRRILATPFAWLMAALVLGLGLLDAVLGAAGGLLLAFNKPQRKMQLENVQEGLRDVKALWQTRETRPVDTVKFKKL